MHPLLIFLAAAIAEIAGCWCVWAVARLGKPVWWLVPGIMSLAAFAWLLTLIPIDHAGRAYAAYGGIYVLASLNWLWVIEGVRPDRWDLLGVALCVAGTLVILLAPRTS